MTKPENLRFRAFVVGRNTSYKDVCVVQNLAFSIVCATKSVVCKFYLSEIKYPFVYFLFCIKVIF